MWPATLKNPDILLSRKSAGVVTIDHIYAGTGVTSKGQYIDTVAVEQPERDAGMP